MSYKYDQLLPLPVLIQRFERNFFSVLIIDQEVASVFDCLGVRELIVRLLLLALAMLSM